MSVYTTQPDTWWPDTHIAIYRDGEPCMSTPKDRVQESIAYLAKGERDHFQDIADRRSANDPRLVIADGCAYSIGSENDYPKGFGGDRWAIRFHDGHTAITTSLWCLGDIPDSWRDRLPDNAVLRVLR